MPGGNETALTGAAMSALSGGGKGSETALAGAALSALGGGGAKGGESALAGAALSAFGGGKAEGVAADVAKVDAPASVSTSAVLREYAGYVQTSIDFSLTTLKAAGGAGMMGEATQFAQSAAGKSLLAEAQKSLCT